MHERAAERLARAADEVGDVALRVSFVRHELQRLPSADAVDVLRLAQLATHARDVRARKLFLIAGIGLAPSAATPLRAQLADAALQRGHRELARILVRDPVESPEAERVPDFGFARPITLGERKSLARRRDRPFLVRVLADPHPDVIRLLLGNPMMVEADIVRLATRRPIAPDVARELAGSPRWMLRPAIQVALVKNPGTPRDVSLWLVPLLPGAELTELRNDPATSPAIRAAAEAATTRAIPA